MPAKHDLTWEPSTRRWKKIVHGKALTVSCRQLVKLGYLPIGAPETKEASRTAANKWLQDRLNSPTEPDEPQTQFDYAISVLERRKAWLLAHGKSGSAFDGQIAALRQMEKDGDHPSLANDFVNDRYEIWEDRLTDFQQTPCDLTVGYWADQFLAKEKVDVDAGELSQDGFDQIRWVIETFKNWMTAEAHVETINAQRWSDWYDHVQKLKRAAWTRKKLYAYAKTFVMYLCERGVVKPFDALHSKRHRFSITRKETPPMSVARIKEILGEAKGVMRLHLLLMINCGMTQKDISDLTPDEYEDGRITRVRSKTEHLNTRKVAWKLWDETKRLLDEHRQQEGERLLLTSKGTTWVGTGRRDGIRMIYRPLGCKEPLKLFRSTAGNMVEKKYGKDVADHFLGHKQGSVDSAYFFQEQKRLDAAVAWLGRQILG